MLGDVVAAAQTSRTQASAAVGRTPLLDGPSLNAGAIAQALRDGIDKSGLFYESHVAEWADGTRPRADLALEPQARGMPPPTIPDTAQFINLQLTAHEQGASPGRANCGRARTCTGKSSGTLPAAQDGGAGEGTRHVAEQPAPALRRAGRGGGAASCCPATSCTSASTRRTPRIKGMLDAHRARLAQALDAAGTPLSTLAIHDAAADGEAGSMDRGRDQSAHAARAPSRWPMAPATRRRRSWPRARASSPSRSSARAKEAGVFVHESKELVALLMEVDLDRQIPPALYRAIAELLAWLYHIESAQVSGQTAPPAPDTTPLLPPQETTPVDTDASNH